MSVSILDTLGTWEALLQSLYRCSPLWPFLSVSLGKYLALCSRRMEFCITAILFSVSKLVAS